MKPLKVGEALQQARRLLESGKVRLTTHISDRMTELDFQIRDVTYCFQVGKIYTKPVWDSHHKAWKYVVEGKDIEGRKLSIVFAFDEDAIVLITGVREKGFYALSARRRKDEG